jgi:hypothetical protein
VQWRWEYSKLKVLFFLLTEKNVESFPSLTAKHLEKGFHAQ